MKKKTIEDYKQEIKELRDELYSNRNIIITTEKQLNEIISRAVNLEIRRTFNKYVGPVSFKNS